MKAKTIAALAALTAGAGAAAGGAYLKRKNICPLCGKEAHCADAIACDRDKAL